MFVVLTVAILGQASTGIARTDGFTGLDQIGAFILFSTIVASFVLAWCAVRLGLHPLPAGEHVVVRRLLVARCSALTLSAGWLEILGLLVADKATGGVGRHDRRSSAAASSAPWR